jgi:5-methylcytosine-specific restriction endonuclease McrA
MGKPRIELPDTLWNEGALVTQYSSIYSSMRTRAKPKLWKTGIKKGKIRVNGLDSLPFTRDELLLHGLKLLGGMGMVRCPYCVDVGRNARLIDIRTCKWDHFVSLAQGGTWELSNLRPCCPDCNNLKGKMSYDLFTALMSEMEKWPNQNDRTYFYACLRSHGQLMQHRKDDQKEREKAEQRKNLPPPPAKTRSLDFDPF